MSSKSGPQEIGTTLKTCLLIIGISHKNRNSQLLAAHMKLTAAVGCHTTQRNFAQQQLGVLSRLTSVLRSEIQSVEGPSLVQRTDRRE
jgi:hypothetical protein